MTIVYIKDSHYRRIVLLGEDAKQFVKDAVEEKLDREEEKDE